ncbi:MAG: polysaccharide deacetylase family protein [Chitinophagaceae bacterium]
MINKAFLSKTGIRCFACLCLVWAVSCTNDNTPQHKIDTSSVAVPQHDTTHYDSSKKEESHIQAEDDSIPLDSAKKYVFLTFDDGPQPGTDNVIQSIKETGTKASFFMVGLHATFSPLMRSYVDQIRSGAPSFWLANHSYTHAFNDRYLAFYHHPADAYNDFMRADSTLHIPEHIFRFPGNNAWVLDSGRMRGTKLVRPVMHIMDSIGGRVIGWDVEWHFKRNPHGAGSVPVQSAGLMARQLINTLEKNETYRKKCIVLLAHDRMFHLPSYKDSLVTMINIVKQEHPEYVFETVEKLRR